MLYWFSRCWPLRRNFTSGDVTIFWMSVSISKPFCNYNSICGWNITISGFEIQTSAILEFYFRFHFRPHHRSRHVILHQSAKCYRNPSAHGREITSCWFLRWQISAILNFMGPIMGSLKIPCMTSYMSSTKTVALNCLVFEKIAFLHFGNRQTDTQRDRQTDR